MENNIEKCPNCEAEIEIPEDVMIGEIVSCPDCGLDFVVDIINGKTCLSMVAIEAEDWGQ